MSAGLCTDVYTGVDIGVSAGTNAAMRTDQSAGVVTDVHAGVNIGASVRIGTDMCAGVNIGVRAGVYMSQNGSV